MAAKAKEKTAEAAISKNGFSLISDRKLKQLYRTMLQCRVLEKHIQLLYAENNLARDRRSFLGQEASKIGVAIDLRPADTVALTPRNLLADLIKRPAFSATLLRLYAISPADQHSSPRSSHAPTAMPPESSTFAEQLRTGIRIALANKLKKNRNVVVVFLAEGSTSHGPQGKALKFAGEEKLSMIFVLQRDLAGNGKRRTVIPDSPLRMELNSVPRISVDGNDVVAVYRVAYESIARARRGSGPTLIECNAFPLTDHFELAVASREGKAPVELRASDPITSMEVYLARKGLFRESWKQKLLSDFKAELQQTFAGVGDFSRSVEQSL